MPGPVSGLAVGYSPAVNGRTYPAHRPLLQLDQMLTSGAVRASDGRVLPPVGSHKGTAVRWLLEERPDALIYPTVNFASMPWLMWKPAPCAHTIRYAPGFRFADSVFDLPGAIVPLFHFTGP